MLRVDHVAVLVRSLETVLATLPEGVVIGEVEEFPGEGTRECYVTGAETDHAALLLLEAIAPGPYERALRCRGPGLHHVAVTVPSLEQMAQPLSAWGMRLHPHSLESIPRGTAWACGGGVPFLLEIHAREQPATQAFLRRIEMPIPAGAPVDLIAPGLFLPRGDGLALHFSTGGVLAIPSE